MPYQLVRFDRSRHCSTQLRYISLFACENSHCFCTVTCAKAETLTVVSGPGVSFARPNCTETGYLFVWANPDYNRTESLPQARRVQRV